MPGVWAAALKKCVLGAARERLLRHDPTTSRAIEQSDDALGCRSAEERVEVLRREAGDLAGTQEQALFVGSEGCLCVGAVDQFPRQVGAVVQGVDFWRYAADETVARLGLQPGQNLLDVACGPGPAALAAAAAVGADGEVLGVDIAEEMIELARGHAREQGATQASFVVGSMDALDVGFSRFDAATCVFGMFFAADVQASIDAMSHAVRRGGQVAVTTLGPKFFSPLFEVFLDAATTENPQIDTDVPWRRTEDPSVMADHLRTAGLGGVSVTHEVSRLALSCPEDWWRIAMGTGVRRLAMDLDPDALERVRTHNLDWVRQHGIDSVELGVIYTHGWVPASASEPVPPQDTPPLA